MLFCECKTTDDTVGSKSCSEVFLDNLLQDLLVEVLCIFPALYLFGKVKINFDTTAQVKLCSLFGSETYIEVPPILQMKNVGIWKVRFVLQSRAYSVKLHWINGFSKNGSDSL